MQVKEDLYEVHFSIKDTGLGISRENITRLFQPFSQVDTSIAHQYGGTGLGLAISKRLAEMMGGKIWVESQPGIGSNFHFTILATAIFISEINGRHVEPPSAKIEDHSKFTILLAEDNPVNRKVALGMLKKLGYHADAAANGQEVIVALERRHYDVIIMDVQMPQMDGFETTQAIRKRLPATDQPYIIALTAYAMEGDRERCMDAGMNDYIAKPMRMDELKAALDRVNR